MIPDAPYIRETEATGYCSSGWWNNPTEDGFQPACWWMVDDEEEEDD